MRHKREVDAREKRRWWNFSLGATLPPLPPARDSTKTSNQLPGPVTRSSNDVFASAPANFPAIFLIKEYARRPIGGSREVCRYPRHPAAAKSCTRKHDNDDRRDPSIEEYTHTYVHVKMAAGNLFANTFFSVCVCVRMTGCETSETVRALLLYIACRFFRFCLFAGKLTTLYAGGLR